MDYPSLLFTAGPSGHRIDPDVFEDVKLNLFFSQDAIRAMEDVCPASDIPVRQEFLQAFLQAPDTLPRFRAMSDTVDQIWDLADALDAARCTEEHDFIFLNLAAQVLRFSTLAAQAPAQSGFFWDRFAGAFRGFTDSEAFQAASRRCADVLEQTAALRRSCWQVQGDHLSLRQETGANLTDQLLDCARELGFPDVEGARATSIRLSPALLSAQAKLNPEAFEAMNAFAATFQNLYDPRILDYRSEMNFYLEAAALVQRLQNADIPTVWPAVSHQRRLWIQGAYDISLLTKNEVTIIPNDIDFSQDEPFWFLTGANGGGKTTYLRCVGINIVLFLSGCPVAGSAAQVYPVSSVFTHFPRDERSDSEGRLSEEQARVDDILARHGGDALVLLNETYSAANAEQAPKLTLDLATQLAQSGSFGLFITHQHALADGAIPFLSVVIDEDSANRRTFKIERRRGAARSFAEDILKRYNMDRDSLRARFGL
mgnify:CR=1 FL=1